MKHQDWNWFDQLITGLRRKEGGSSNPSRREFLGGVAAVGAVGTGVALVSSSGLLAQTGSATANPKNGRIDVHNHYACPALLEAVGVKRLGAGVINWSPEKALADMDSGGVATVLTSIAPQGDPFGDADVSGWFRSPVEFDSCRMQSVILESEPKKPSTDFAIVVVGAISSPSFRDLPLKPLSILT